MGREDAPPPLVTPAQQLPVQQIAPPPATDWLALAPDVAIPLVRVPAGEFLMGTGEEDPQAYWLIENPQFRFHLGEYRIARYPTTVAQFAAFVRATGYRTEAEARGKAWTFNGREWDEIDGADWQHPRGPSSNIAQKWNHPVTQVSWNDALAFCRWASEASGITVGLPSEPEWEKAARGTDGRSWCWGEDSPDANRCNFGWNVNDTTPVGAYSPGGDSPYGCADMAGNVWEWTADSFCYYPYPKDNPPAPSKERVVRGGGFHLKARSVRCAYRSWIGPSDCTNCGGFRVRVSA